MDDLEITIEGFTPVEPEQEICGVCERLSCPTLHNLGTLPNDTPFEWKYIVCDYTKPNAWNDPNKRKRGNLEGSKCGRCKRISAHAGVCLRCADVLRWIYG